eukprot:comp19583_c0_seq1/m.37399 comp19583_c0_seq1/g.37399  ORF comp19583_c0_seq1/g.37399 comp19583_c0_seq1/m.37399 type:complete len:289 (+) comp19583_c0_seq1:151-1017(+)
MTPPISHSVEVQTETIDVIEEKEEEEEEEKEEEKEEKEEEKEEEEEDSESDESSNTRDPNAMIDEMKQIETEYEILKEKYFSERFRQLDDHAAKLEAGNEEVFQRELALLEENQRFKTETAERWRRYQLANINNVFDAERQQANDDYNAHKEVLREKMLNFLLDKQRKLEEEIALTAEKLARHAAATGTAPGSGAAAAAHVGAGSGAGTGAAAHAAGAADETSTSGMLSNRSSLRKKVAGHEAAGMNSGAALGIVRKQLAQTASYSSLVSFKLPESDIKSDLELLSCK